MWGSWDRPRLDRREVGARLTKVRARLIERTEAEVTAWELGTADIEGLFALCEVLDMTPNWLFGYE